MRLFVKIQFLRLSFLFVSQLKILILLIRVYTLIFTLKIP